MNEPYQRVHRQENSNSTIGTVATHIGLGLVTSAAVEGGTVAGAKFAKNPHMKEYMHSLAYQKGVGPNKFMRAMSSGIATRPGRIVNYGSTAVGGLITGMIASGSN